MKESETPHLNTGPGRIQTTGYRNDSWGVGITDIREIYLFEIFELGNVDVIDYALEHYITGMSEEDASLLTRLSENSTMVFDIEHKEQQRLVEVLLSSVYKNTKQQVKYGRWLASIDVINTLYDGSKENIRAYETSDVILSDLGFNEEGVLFGYTEDSWRAR